MVRPGFQAGPTFPTIPTFPYFFVKMPYYPYFFVKNKDIYVKKGENSVFNKALLMLEREYSFRMSVLFLAHLSQRLIGELIGYSWSGVRPSSSVVRPS